MNRRNVGIGAIKNKNVVQAKFKDKGNEISNERLSEMSEQVEIFRKNLEEFATKHREEIRKNPKFRSQFQEMCAAIGVDPLASSKGFWAKMLGVGDFYYELGVQIIEVCLATSHKNGGLITLEELSTKLAKSRGRNKQEISIEDILASIQRLKSLGNGFKAIPMGHDGQYLIQSVPGELNMDHTMVLKEAEEKSYVTKSILSRKLSWEDERIKRALDFLTSEGMAWLDNQLSEEQFWFPSLFSAASYSN